MRNRNIWPFALGVVFAVCAMMSEAEEPNVRPAMAAEQQNLFAMEAETPVEADAFSIEVIATAQPKAAKRVLIYHTHTYEAFAQEAGERYQETEKWRTADPAYNVVRVGEELSALLRSLGVEVVHDTTAFEPPTLSSAYARSLDMLKARSEAGERYDLYIDLHRDAYVAAQKGGNTVRVGGVETARLMMLIGKGEGSSGQGFDEKPDWEANLRIARALTDGLNAQAEGLCREVSVKKGRYNQHVAQGCVLVEVGNNQNTLEQVLAAMPYLADAIDRVLESSENT